MKIRFRLALSMLIGGVIACGSVVADDDKRTTEVDDDVSVKAEADTKAKATAVAKATTSKDLSDQKSDGDKTSIRVRTFGKVVRVGPDGKIEVKEFNSDSDDGKGTDVQIDLKNWLSKRAMGAKSLDVDVDAEVTEDSEDQGTKSSTKRSVSLRKILRIGEDGLLKEIDLVPVDIEKIINEALSGTASGGSRVTIVGPNGKKNQIDLGSESRNLDGLDDLIGSDEIHAEVRKEIENAMEQLRKRMPKHGSRLQDIQRRLQSRGSRSSSNDTEDSAGINGKLDEILKRLGKLEAEVSQLKKRAED